MQVASEKNRAAVFAYALLLCALVQVASKAVVTIDLKQSSSALRTCASCFSHEASLHRLKCASALCTCASCFQRRSADLDFLSALLLCALVQVASRLCFFSVQHKCLLLCALVQVASRGQNAICNTAVFCSVHLCKLLRQNCTVLCVRQ